MLNLRVALDGETQGNDYQDTLAELQMKFAVELNNTESGDEPPEKEPTKKKNTTTNKVNKVNKVTKTNKVVKTGDYTDMIPYLIAAGISGFVLLILAIYSLRERRRQRGGTA